MLDARTKFLIVEDDPGVRTALVRDLTSRGFTHVRQAVDGVHALEVLREELADCMISDGAMPRMDGFELLETVKRDPVLQSVHVLIMSGGLDPARRERAKAAGALACLGKPLDLDRVLPLFEQAPAR